MNELTPQDIVELRKRRGWSQEDLASMLGVPTGYVRGWETKLAWMDQQAEDHLVMLGAIPGAGGPEPIVVDPAAARPLPREEPAPQVDRSDGIRRVSNSEVQSFKQCRRKWWLGWYRGLAPKKPPMVGPMMVGNRLHRALEVGYAVGGPFYEQMLHKMERIIEADRELIKDYDDVTKEQFVKESDLERIMLEGYVQWAEETGTDENLEIVGSEQYVEADLQPFAHHGGLKIIGRLDVVVKQKSNDALRFMDHKSLDNFGRVTKTMRIAEQPKHYQLLNWLTREPGQRVGGMIFNMLRRVKRTPKATPPFYAREEITHNRPTMEAYYDRLVSEIFEIVEIEDRLEMGVDHQMAVPPTVSQYCEWGCPFLQICSMFDDGSRVEDAVTELYEVVDPLSYYDKDKEGDE